MMRGLRTFVATGGVMAAALVVWPASPPESPVLVTPVAAEAEPFPESTLWMAPANDPVRGSNLALGVELLAAGRAADALPFFLREVDHPSLGAYARLYVGRVQTALGQHEAAVGSARDVIATAPGGAIGQAALWLMAETFEAGSKWREAVPVWQTITGLNSPRTAESYLRLAQAAAKAGNADVSKSAYATLYYEYPATPEGEKAALAMTRSPFGVRPDQSRLDLGRAEKLFAARRYADARKAFVALRAYTSPDLRAVADLRVAQSDFHLNRFTAARDALRVLRAKPGPSSVDVDFYWLGTLRGLKRGAEYEAAVTAFATKYPSHARTEAALNDLATYYILANDDRRAAEVFTRQYAAFPSGAFADRAAWKAGWWAYRTANYRETIRLFESAAVAMRRADYRPSWLYWAAKAHENLGEREAAAAGYRETITYYRNSYYGREAQRALTRLLPARVTQAAVRPAAAAAPLTLTPGPRPHTAPLIEALLGAGLYDDAIAELQTAAREHGTSPLIEATIAYALNRKGQLRPGITAMRRAYPQFMAEGGEALPERILKVIFPVAYEPLLARYAGERQLDRYLLTALVAQESTFQADVRSSANAWGLMQLLPATGRRVGLQIGVKGVTTSRLTDPDLNVRLGTAYLAALLKQFGDEAKALAGYNAGEHRVVRWQAERPGLDRDEFVDDIPFPETQNYVKRILGTAEDYRILYGGAARP